MPTPPKINDLCQGADNNFNLIRILSAWGVLFAHSYVLIEQKPNITDPFQTYFSIGMGTFFVTVFFAISGFLIFRSLDRSQDLKRYIIARCKRIFPALFVVLLLTVLILGPLTSHLNTSEYFSNPDTWLYLSNINLLDIHIQFHLPGVFTHNPYPSSINGSLWTLPIETWMYVMTAVVFCLKSIIKHYRASWGKILLPPVLFCLAFFACLQGEHYLSTQQAQKYSILIFICIFTTGSLLYQYRQKIPLMWSIGLALLIIIPWIKDSFIYPIYFSICIAYITLVISYLPKGKILSYNKFGDYSYGLYIYAFPTQQTLIMLQPNINFIEILVSATLISLLLAAFSWHAIESPILKHKKSKQLATSNN